MRQALTTTKIWYLSKVNLFGQLSSAEMEALANLSRMERIAKRQTVYLPGDPAETVFVIKEGRVKISRLSPDGKEITLAILKEGELFGELSLVETGQREEIAEALAETVLCVIKKEDFEGLLKQKAGLALSVTKLIGFRRRELESKLEELAFRDVPARLANLLIKLARDFGGQDQKGTRISLKLTHRDIGNLVGASRETITLALNDFKRMGLIDFDRRNIIVLKKEGLRALI